MNSANKCGLWIATLTLSLLPCGIVQSGQEVAQIPFFSAPPGTAGLGGGLRTGQSLYRAFDSDDERQIDLLPLYLYNGEYLFARGTSGGVHLLTTGLIELNLLGRYRFEKLDPDGHEFYEGIEDREQTVDVGVELRVSGGWGDLTVDWLADALDRHNGEDRRGLVSIYDRTRAVVPIAVPVLVLAR